MKALRSHQFNKPLHPLVCETRYFVVVYCVTRGYEMKKPEKLREQN